MQTFINMECEPFINMECKHINMECKHINMECKHINMECFINMECKTFINMECEPFINMECKHINMECKHINKKCKLYINRKLYIVMDANWYYVYNPSISLADFATTGYRSTNQLTYKMLKGSYMFLNPLHHRLFLDHDIFYF